MLLTPSKVQTLVGLAATGRDPAPQVVCPDTVTGRSAHHRKLVASAGPRSAAYTSPSLAGTRKKSCGLKRLRTVGTLPTLYHQNHRPEQGLDPKGPVQMP